MTKPILKLNLVRGTYYIDVNIHQQIQVELYKHDLHVVTIQGKDYALNFLPQDMCPTYDIGVYQDLLKLTPVSIQIYTLIIEYLLENYECVIE